jgi:N-acetylated-alpha-linked acidic dipeptidase
MKKTLTLSLLMLSAASFAQQKTLIGFTPASSAKQIASEKTFDSALSAQRIGETIKTSIGRPA